MTAQAEAGTRQVLAELRARFPHVHFLEPTVSNRQIIAEGVAAMFTIHGTAGHEFAYLGVPVVNAGDNQHIAYPFNIHPKNLSDYRDRCIAHADRLELSYSRQETSRNTFTWPIFTSRSNSRSAVNPMPAEFFESAEYRLPYSRPETFDVIQRDLSAAEKQELTAYFDRQLRPWEELFTALPEPAPSLPA